MKHARIDESFLTGSQNNQIIAANREGSALASKVFISFVDI